MAITPPVPYMAANAGYNTLTLGPQMQVANAPGDSGNWNKFNFFGTPIVNDVTINDDGNVVLGPNTANNYAAMLCTASFVQSPSPYIKGIAFGGGGYFEVIMSGVVDTSVGGPAFWCNDIERMAGFSAGDFTLAQWPGQPAGYDIAVEIDFAEFDAGMSSQQYGQFAHNFFGVNLVQPQIGFGSANAVPAQTDFSLPHRFGFLWIPATAAKQGSGTWYFDRSPIGPKLMWNKFDPALAPPPVIQESAFSIMDQRHMALILGNFGVNPITIQGVSVWQASSANNIVL